MIFQDGDLILLALNKTQYNLLLIYKALAFLGESIPIVFLAKQSGFWAEITADR